ncbi:hypothetical protein KFL_006780010 [Klebsormidium nitens]|uniref:Uncharacterized protein n=1 Tax=Klebsormidium nitens TaxID=105231 RepID=A0A1Y1IIP4_KLENI|nr:hypothetical protein KFL_006780010 [Klebsormidium nitens]|eukprot:GAQ90730.1 hypothetical protein KFL_006780010 [Klebsormidium nitens]
MFANQTGAHPAHMAPGNYEGRQVHVGQQLPPQDPALQSHPPHFQPQYSPPTGHNHHHNWSYVQHQYAPQSHTQSSGAQQYSQPTPQNYLPAGAPAYVHAYGASLSRTARSPDAPAAASPAPAPASQDAGGKQNSTGDQLKKMLEAGKKMMKQDELTPQQQAAKQQQKAAKEQQQAAREQQVAMNQAMCAHSTDYMVEEPTGFAWLCCCFWLLTGNPAPCTQIRCTNCDLIVQS